MPEGFYNEKLYPFQDQILDILCKRQLPFYLTGGTALSRHYLRHRYSDDLDFFVNQSPNFKRETTIAVEAIRSAFNNVEIVMSDENFLRLFVINNDVTLKVEFINDVAFHEGEIIDAKLFYRTDNWKNILSNKISALSRNEEKDIADILFLSMQFNFSWVDVISSAKEKDMWVNELEISKKIHDFEINRLNKIKWISLPDFHQLEKVKFTIAEAILRGEENASVKS